MTRGTADFRWRGLLRGPKTTVEDEQIGAGGPALSVDGCDLIRLSSADALLRVSGTWTPSAPAEVELLIASGATVKALPPGPAVTGDGRWSTAFAVDPAAAEGPLALVSEATGAISLPQPALQAPSVQQADPVEELEQARELIVQLRRRCELSERGLSDFRDKLVQAWGEASHMRQMLDAREATFATATQREEQAHAMVGELETRARRSEQELERQRREMTDECARLEAELARRADDEQLATATAEAAAMRAHAAEALERFEAARSEADLLDQRVAQAKSMAGQATDLAAHAARELLAERARNEEAVELAERHSERLAKAERELAEAAEQLAAAQQRIEELEANSGEQLAAAQQRIEELEANSGEALAALKAAYAEAERERDGATGRIGELESKSAETLAELETAQAEAEQLRERVAHAEQGTAELATSEQGL
ncbi:MAG: hypothetical protein QOF37_1333, partial [Thermoleophilaceae bacterium]|nr:hypothetical protein [Thermoleophilaceae bacterium]